MLNIRLQTILERADAFSYSDQDLSNLLGIPEKIVKTIRKMFKDGEPEAHIEMLFRRKKIYTIDEIESIVHSCADGLDIESVNIIGSYAKGTPSASSDLDILVIDNNSTDIWEKDNEYLLFEKRLKESFEVPVDILYYTALQKSPLKLDLLEKVVNIYGKEL